MSKVSKKSAQLEKVTVQKDCDFTENAQLSVKDLETVSGGIAASCSGTFTATVSR
ncbi:hypothetical protein H1P_810029 [Hyella patelloides LEGE 07179]|uniref:Uncharacterized protein n=1 Tax=Hyella patelloides LEGE 07179 TaxID=945734 RepID=A0A563W4J7_9CYAN|nr:hypothetical protein [Hyella patelloides]VEP18567.1 hypothetical protein H1P_810029 [Hyella patelloides LEGE 07179]